MMRTTFTAGDTFAHTEQLAAYPAGDGWVAKLRLVARSGDAAPIEFASAPDGDAHAFSQTSAQTADWAPGFYTEVLWVERGGEVHTVRQGQQIAIAPNPRSLTQGTDLRSVPRKVLDDLLAARADYATGPNGRTARYRIGDRDREFKSAAELDAEIRFWQGQLQADEDAARLAAGKRPRNNLFVRFTRPR